MLQVRPPQRKIIIIKNKPHKKVQPLLQRAHCYLDVAGPSVGSTSPGCSLPFACGYDLTSLGTFGGGRNSEPWAGSQPSSQGVVPRSPPRSTHPFWDWERVPGRSGSCRGATGGGLWQGWSVNLSRWVLRAAKVSGGVHHDSERAGDQNCQDSASRRLGESTGTRKKLAWQREICGRKLSLQRHLSQ